LPQISRKIAFTVAKTAIAQDLARDMTDDELLASIERNFWSPVYREYRRIA
jgi:malate dehydrogenase (oxaloacetate-decarboxylating)